jgi:DNA-directed RNA polymerase delta subunit
MKEVIMLDMSDEEYGQLVRNDLNQLHQEMETDSRYIELSEATQACFVQIRNKIPVGDWMPIDDLEQAVRKEVDYYVSRTYVRGLRNGYLVSRRLDEWFKK